MDKKLHEEILKCFDAYELALDSLRSEVREMKASIPVYHGVWNAAGVYERNAQVTHSGCLWWARERTTDRPGKSDSWILMHKSQDGGRS